jgi:RNA polymerase sigma factor (sigma-70 family)
MSTSFFSPGEGAFPETHWSIIHRAKGAGKEAEKAISDICTEYWFPVYVFLRRRSKDRFEAEDLTQSFFSHLLEDNLVLSASQNHGRFRAFLIRCCQNFCVDDHRYNTAQKRGGGQKFISIDSQEAELRYSRIGRARSTTERDFTRNWAITLIERTFERLEDEYRASQKLDIYNELRPTLAKTKDSSALTYRQIGMKLDMTESAVKKAAQTLKARFASEIRDLIGETVSHPSEVENELRELMAAFQS